MRRLSARRGGLQPLEVRESDYAFQLMLLLEQERRLMALDLHDGVAQGLARLFYRIQMCEFMLEQDTPNVRAELAHIHEMAQSSLDEVTRLVYNLRPPALDEVGVFAAVKRSVLEYERDTGSRILYSIDNRRKRFDKTFEVFIYRIVQEALTNVKKHAHATSVEVALHVTGRDLHGHVSDNGRGFSETEVSNENRPRMGLLGMKERTALLNGRLTVASQPGQGTVIAFEIPLRAVTRPQTGR